MMKLKLNKICSFMKSISLTLRGVQNQRHSTDFRPRGLQLIKPGVTILQSIFNCIKLLTSQTKIGGVSLIWDTAICRGQILRRRSTSAVRNSAFNTLYPLWQTFSEPFSGTRNLFLEHSKLVKMTRKSQI